MRYIKFRSLQRAGNKKIELVRVSDNGKIIPKGYGPLDLQVLDGNVKDQGVNISPGRILCYGATNTIDDINIVGTVDVYIDGIDGPVATNVTEEQLRNFTAADYQNLLKPYTPKPTTPTESFHFLMQSIPNIVSGPQQDFRASMVYGVKQVDQDIEWFTTDWQTENDWYSNRFFFYTFHLKDLPMYIQNEMNDAVGIPIDCKVKSQPFIKPDDIYTKLKHGDYFRKMYGGFIGATAEKPYMSKSGRMSFPVAVNLSFEMDAPIEYIVFPSLTIPYGNGDDKFLLNTTMMYDNIVHYQDGRIVTNDQTVPALRTTNLYQQDNVTLINIPTQELDVETTFDISQVSPVFDQPTLLEGRYVDIKFEQGDFDRLVVGYTTADTAQFQTQGIFWLDTKLGGRESRSLTMAGQDMDALYSVDVGFMTLSPQKTTFQVYGLSADVIYRIKFPADVTEFTLTLSV